MTKTTHALLGLGLAATFFIAGCGPDSTTRSTSSPSDHTSHSTSHQSDANGRDHGGSSQQLEAIRTCLKKAGLADKLPQRGPGSSSERPSAPPTGQPPSGGPGGADHKAGGPFADQDVQNALKACGIDVPEPPQAPAPG